MEWKEIFPNLSACEALKCRFERQSKVSKDAVPHLTPIHSSIRLTRLVHSGLLFKYFVQKSLFFKNQIWFNYICHQIRKKHYIIISHLIKNPTDWKIQFNSNMLSDSNMPYNSKVPLYSNIPSDKKILLIEKSNHIKKSHFIQKSPLTQNSHFIHQSHFVQKYHFIHKSHFIQKSITLTLGFKWFNYHD